jgi:hypothetical protein
MKIIGYYYCCDLHPLFVIQLLLVIKLEFQHLLLHHIYTL